MGRLFSLDRDARGEGGGGRGKILFPFSWVRRSTSGDVVRSLLPYTVVRRGGICECISTGSSGSLLAVPSLREGVGGISSSKSCISPSPSPPSLDFPSPSFRILRMFIRSVVGCGKREGEGLVVGVVAAAL
jgi:hypothetical protein